MTISTVVVLSFWAGACATLALISRRDGHEYGAFLLIGACSLLGAVVIGVLNG